MNKRLFRKWSFLLILCLVPLLTAGMRLAAGQESGVLSIALYLPESGDGLSAEIPGRLEGRDGVLRYVACGTEEEARRMVEAFEADAAWIFPEKLEESLRDAASHKRT